MSIAELIDQHRVARHWSGNREKAVECECGHKSVSLLSNFRGPVTEENSPRRDAGRLHAQHVADVLAAQEVSDEEPSSPVAAAHNRAVSRSRGERGLFQ